MWNRRTDGQTNPNYSMMSSEKLQMSGGAKKDFAYTAISTGSREHGAKKTREWGAKESNLGGAWSRRFWA